MSPAVLLLRTVVTLLVGGEVRVLRSVLVLLKSRRSLHVAAVPLLPVEVLVLTTPPTLSRATSIPPLHGVSGGKAPCVAGRHALVVERRRTPSIAECRVVVGKGLRRLRHPDAPWVGLGAVVGRPAAGGQVFGYD